MDFMELAAKRYSVRKFSGEKVSREHVEQILKAAHLAPTGCNNQPQRIYVLESEEALQKLKECTPYHFHAPLTFALCYDRGRSWKRSYDGADSGPVDTSIVGTHMILEACTLGVGSTWVMMFDPAKLREAFSVPEELDIVALLPMGYPAENARPSRLHSQFIPFEDMTEFI